MKLNENNEIFILISTITIINEKCLHDKNELMSIAQYHVGQWASCLRFLKL